MTSEVELGILDFLSKKLLARPHEMKAELHRYDGADGTLSELVSKDYVQVIEPLGERCFVITHKGTKVLHDAKASGWRAAAQASQGSQCAQGLI